MKSILDSKTEMLNIRTHGVIDLRMFIDKGWMNFILFASIFSVLGGCKMDDSRVDNVIAEMELAWIEADKTGQGHEARDKAASTVAKKYFRPGATRTEVTQLLQELKNSGYEIGEYRYEGARNWPAGPLRPYNDEATKRNFQSRIPKGVSEFVASKKYGRTQLIITKHVSISFRLSDAEDKVFDVNAKIWQNSI